MCLARSRRRQNVIDSNESLERSSAPKLQQNSLTGLQVHCTPELDSALPSFLSLGFGDGALFEGVGDVGLPGVSKRAVGQHLPSRHRVSVGLHRGNTGGGTGSEAGGGRGSGTTGHFDWLKLFQVCWCRVGCNHCLRKAAQERQAALSAKPFPRTLHHSHVSCVDLVLKSV